MAYRYRAVSIKTGKVIEGNAEYIGNELFSNRYSVQEAANLNRLLLDEWKVEWIGKEVFKRICKYEKCQKEFETMCGHKVFCCTECAVAAQGAERSKIKITTKKKSIKIQSMEEVQRMARAAGMSYGMYVARNGL